MMFVLPILISAAIVAVFGVVKGSWLVAMWLGIGFVIGLVLMKADEWWLHTLYDTPPSSTESEETSDTSTADQSSVPVPEVPTTTLPLITRSALFLLAYLPMALFVVTSSGSWIGSGMVLGIGLVLLSEFLSLRNNEPAFRSRFVPHLKSALTSRDMTLTIAVFSGLLLFLIIKLFV